MVHPNPENLYLAQYRHRATVVAAPATQTSVAPDALTGATITGTITGTPNGAMADITALALSTAGGNTYADAGTNTEVNAKITLFNAEQEELQAGLNEILADITSMHTQLTALVADITEGRTQLAALIAALKSAGLMKAA